MTSLEYFKNGYLTLREIEKRDEEKVEEAFMAGAHTVALLVKNGESIEAILAELELFKLNTEFKNRLPQ